MVALIRPFMIVGLLLIGAMSHSATTLVYFGSQDPQGPMGLALATFDTETGALSTPKLIAETPDPAFLAVRPGGTQLYLCNTGTPGGVSAFAIDRTSGTLRFLNHKPSSGRGPSHIGLDRGSRYVLDANYGGGFVEIHAIEPDGSLGERTAFVQHTGRSVHPQRQTKPYAHWFGVDPSNRFALAADLGTDRIVVYRFDAASGTLTPHDPPHAGVRAGSGPRHLAWHPNGRIAYAIQELSNEIIVFSWDASKGVLGELQTIATLPADFSGTNTAAEIAVHPNGRFLYASNRGHDSIAVYSIDEATGHLSLLQHVSSRGKTPRFFTFDPTDRWLIVNNQESDDVVVFAVDAASGKLAPHGESVKLARPMGVAFLR
jgi:6-phosphogluconolactonase